jgi:hypothetical protein
MWPAFLITCRLNAMHESVGTGLVPDAPHHSRGFGSGAFAFFAHFPRLPAGGRATFATILRMVPDLPLPRGTSPFHPKDPADETS